MKQSIQIEIHFSFSFLSVIHVAVAEQEQKLLINAGGYSNIINAILMSKPIFFLQTQNHRDTVGFCSNQCDVK